MKKGYKIEKRGFTLLEIIIVIIIIGVLASLALPRLFKTVEYSRAAEGLAGLSTIRHSMDRCYMQRGGTYTNCDIMGNLDIDDPGITPGTHFTYGWGGGAGATTYTITAQRNTYEGGTTGSTITINERGVKSGTTAFSGID